MEAYDIIFVILFAWLGVITGLFVWIFVFLRKLIEGVGKENLVKILDKVLEKEKSNTNNIKNLHAAIARIDKEALNNIKKVAVAKFNPFDELGGDHSFSACLLDGEANGFILTSIHTREKTRVYIKEIQKGKGKVDLSKEERNVLQEALD